MLASSVANMYSAQNFPVATHIEPIRLTAYGSTGSFGPVALEYQRYEAAATTAISDPLIPAV